MKYRGKTMTRNLKLNGFALPTVMIASLVMFIVLLAAVSSTVAIRTALNDQYYNKLAQSAADAGAAYAKACLASNDGKQTWASAGKLVPGAGCNGVYNAAFCAAGAACNYVYTDNEYIRTSFEVECAGAACAINVKPENLKITGKVELILGGGGLAADTWRSYSQVSRLTRSTIVSSQVAIGYGHTCVIAFNGGLFCWGGYAAGQLGYDVVGTQYLTPMNINNRGDLFGKTIKFIAAGSGHTCAFDSTGKTYCWGLNSGAQLGMGSKYLNGQTSVPEAISGSLSFTYLSAGDFHTCGVSSGKAYCWGRDSYGQIGDSSTLDGDSHDVPTAVKASGSGDVLYGKTVKVIASGHAHSCALTSNATGNNVFCWGQRNYGQLGSGSISASPEPVPVAVFGSMNFSDISKGSGNGYNICGIYNGKAYCWGRGDLGQIGDGNATQKNSMPTAVAATSADALYNKTIIAITTGDNHACAIDSAGAAYCWGDNTYGQLGNGDTLGAQQNKPVKVRALLGDVLYGKKLVSIAAGAFNTCAVDDDGYAYCWGRNNIGQFGDGTTTDSPVPVKTSVPVVIDLYF